MTKLTGTQKTALLDLAGGRIGAFMNSYRYPTRRVLLQGGYVTVSGAQYLITEKGRDVIAPYLVKREGR